MARWMIWLLLSPSLLAAESTLNLKSDSLDFYRLQAQLAPLQEDRIALNHIGILGTETNEGFLLSAVLEGYPAHIAGLMRGDVIVSSNDHAFHPVFSFNGSAIPPAEFTASADNFDLSVQRDDQILTASVTPVFENLFDSLRTATLNSVQQFSAGNKTIGYVHFWTLSRSANDLIGNESLMNSLALCDGIILDLRNSAGYLDRDLLALFQAISPRLNIVAAAQWLENWQSSNQTLDFETFRKPVAVLINEYTEGGAEILAHEISKLERIVSLGSTTAGRIGKYSIEPHTNEISYEPALETQVDGASFEGVGIQAERLLEFPITESRRDDPQFNEATNLLLGII